MCQDSERERNSEGTNQANILLSMSSISGMGDRKIEKRNIEKNRGAVDNN